MKMKKEKECSRRRKRTVANVRSEEIAKTMIAWERSRTVDDHYKLVC
jgi:hypothetical protein